MSPLTLVIATLDPGKEPIMRKRCADVCFWLGVILTVLIVWAVAIEDSWGTGHYTGGLLLAPIPFTIGWFIRGILVGPKN